MTSAADFRPTLDAPLARLLADLTRKLPELAGIDAQAILPVAVSAHGTAAASVRSVSGCARSVRVSGHARHWELALRPPFFLHGDPTRRLATLVHELLHLDPKRPGALLAHRRHKVRSHQEHEAQARELARSWLAEADVELLGPLGHHGEALMRQWRYRPTEDTKDRAFTGRDLFVGPVVMRTPRRSRSVWW